MAFDQVHLLADHLEDHRLEAVSYTHLDVYKRQGHYHLQAVYSRKMKTAQEFCEPYGAISCYTDFIDFLDSELDVIYIASPNSLHFAQAKLAILAKKHVIIENPAVTKPSEWKELVKLCLLYTSMFGKAGLRNEGSLFIINIKICIGPFAIRFTF